MTTRRTIIKQGALGAATLATASMPWRRLRTQPKPIKVAVIAPLSGPWARQGTLVKWGADTAIAEINELGGVKSMGGAKLEALLGDSQSKVEVGVAEVEPRRSCARTVGAHRLEPGQRGHRLPRLASQAPATFRIDRPRQRVGDRVQVR